MKYLSVESIKKQLNIDEYFSEDDEYLEALGETAEELVEQQVNEDLASIVYSYNGTLPAPLKHAMKLLVGFLYDNRGDDESQIPQAFYYMCKMYRNYK